MTYQIGACWIPRHPPNAFGMALEFLDDGGVFCVYKLDEKLTITASGQRARGMVEKVGARTLRLRRFFSLLGQ